MPADIYLFRFLRFTPLGTQPIVEIIKRNYWRSVCGALKCESPRKVSVRVEVYASYFDNKRHNPTALVIHPRESVYVRRLP